jgi:hypothetical protein
MFFNKEKIFCIGLNKTGTTTLEMVLKNFNYKMVNQEKAELLTKNWFERDFDKILKLCNTADAFQDIPFSLPYTYILLDQRYKNAKFVLTVRDTSEQWYDSITKFHSKIWSDGIDPPNINELKNAIYRYKGFPYEVNRSMFNTPENDPYNKEVLIQYYNNHIYSVKEYFRSNPEKLIVINVAIKDDYYRLCEYLNKKPLDEGFPWENKTSERL